MSEELPAEDLASDSAYECPVCRDALLPPIFQCYNGHLLCSECIDKMRECPVCRDDLPRKHIKALAIENIVRKTRRPCPFSTVGCKELLSKTDETAFEEHRSTCSFAPFNYCSHLGLECDEKLTKGLLLEHLTKTHKASRFPYDFGDKLELSEHECPSPRENSFALDKVEEAEGDERLITRLAFIQTDAHINILKCVEDRKKEMIAWEVLFVGTEKMARKYNTSVKLLSGDSQSAEDNCSLEWKGRVSNLKLDAEEPQKLQDTRRIFSLPYKHFPRLFSSEKETKMLKWKIVLKIWERSNDETEDSYPSSAAQSVVHEHVTCDGDGEGCDYSYDSICGPRYKCLQCPNYDLCQHCMKKKMHAHHLFVTIPRPEMCSPQLKGILRSVAESDSIDGTPFTDPTVVHPSACCDGDCDDNTRIVGPRYKCIECPQYDLCHGCMQKRIHSHHLFVIIPFPHLEDPLNYL